MSKPNTPDAAAILAAITRADDALHTAFYRSRSAHQAAARLSRIRQQNEGRSDTHPDKADDMREAVGLADTITEAAGEVAAALPALRALREAVTGGAAPVPKIADGGMAIVVQYRCPTNASGARWTARFDRDAETVFKASASFTFDDKDNEGADNAAARCLAKFEAYVNEPLPDGTNLPPARFALISRASLGRGAYAYTFRRI